MSSAWNPQLLGGAGGLLPPAPAPGGDGYGDRYGNHWLVDAATVLT